MVEVDDQGPDAGHSRLPIRGPDPHQNRIRLSAEAPAFDEMTDVLEATAVVSAENDLVALGEMQTRIAHDQRAPIPARRLDHAVGRLQSQGRGSNRMPSERDFEISLHRNFFRPRLWVQVGHGWLRAGKRISTDPKECGERPHDDNAAETNEDRPTPSDRLHPLLLLEEVDDPDVEAVAD